MSNLALLKKQHIDELITPGDYCFFVGTDGVFKVAMACPACGGVFYCPHNIVQKEPLTLSPSVVGPKDPFREWNSQVLGPCLHHFWVKDGIAVDIR